MEKLETLPDRVSAVEVPISEFRTEVRVEFSATRTELRQEMRALNDVTLARLDDTRVEMRTLNAQTLAQIDETRAQMLTLHEDVIDRLKIVDIRPARKRANGPRRKP